MKSFKKLATSSIVGDIRNKINSRRFNITNKTGIKIVITDAEKAVGELPTPRSLQLLFRHFPKLQQVNEDFDEFLSIVKTDLKEKSNELKKQRNASSRGSRNYAVIQLFMLQQYEQRLDRFDYLTKQSLFKLSQRFLVGDEIDEEVEEHINIVTKIKRRMKGFLDVSDKHQVLDLNESVHQMNEHCEGLDGDRSSRLGRCL